MYLTPHRVASFALGVLALAMATGGCGQVTGLSDDYVYDLEGGASSGDGGGSGDGATKTDAPTTTESGTDGGVNPINKCSNSQSVRAGQKLAPYNGTAVCKSCLATSCCNDVETCTANADCNHVFSCKLDCTEKSAADRSQCFKSCSLNGGAPSPVYQSTIGACGPAACTKECGLD